MLEYRSYLKEFSRDLRKNMTEGEKLLWSKLRKKQILGVQFYRQKPIGNFIVDFYAPSVKLVVEIDGGQHFQTSNQLQDLKRDKVLNSLGLEVLRVNSSEVIKNVEGVLTEIYGRIKR